MGFRRRKLSIIKNEKRNYNCRRLRRRQNKIIRVREQNTGTKHSNRAAIELNKPIKIEYYDAMCIT